MLLELPFREESFPKNVLQSRCRLASWLTGRCHLGERSNYISTIFHKKLEIVSFTVALFFLLMNQHNVHGIHIRVSEQDFQCLFRSYRDLLRAQ